MRTVTRSRLLPMLPALVLALGIPAGCSRNDDARAAAELHALRAEVAALRAAAAATVDPDHGAGPPADGSDDAITVALRMTTLSEVMAGSAERYLHRVRLHLRPNVVVRAGDDVRVRVGPLNAYAGRWELAVTIQRIDAVLEAGRLDLTVGGADRLNVTVPVHIRSATGDALIDFRWDAARLAGVICSDFAVHEPFSGVVRPRSDVLRGHFTFTAAQGSLIARPALRDRIAVSPEPTEESWTRIRAILNEQNRIFNCGLALSPDNTEAMLRDLLRRGFRFTLPSSILRPIPLPASFVNEVEVGGRGVAFDVQSDPPHLTTDWLWLRATVRAVAADDAPIHISRAH